MLRNKKKGFGSSKWIVLACGLFLICVVTGLIAGRIIRSNHKWSYAASSNVTVTDNNQIVTVTQSASDSAITRTSTVTVNDSTANYGYALTARVSQNTIPGAAVAIGSINSSICSLAFPCALTSSASNILETDNNDATTTGGDTTQWVRCTLCA